MSMTRRKLAQSAAMFCGLTSLSASEADEKPSARLKIVVAGGHPGDPECGCGGTVARYTDLGHQVTMLYFNRGEAYCGGGPGRDCGAVRTAEAAKACELLKARAAFAGQYDGRAVVDNRHYDEFRQLLEAEKPDVMFTHWPIDQHRDHRAISLLVLDAWLRDGKRSALYFYEVTGDTMMFTPTEFVDISGVVERKRAACYAHSSQQPDKWYPEQAALTRLRGKDSGYPQAEAFVRHWASARGFLP